ncbi:MAG TPA: periplasmic heavy metal sensor [Thermoanaerobaculia bacterium]|jgi:Spy/CpxP family protein refolding chaperone|nr:periplasmic heavy metal sensor [Thermoanaerobaculia bacterium]
MRRFLFRLAAVALLGLAVPLSAFAQDAPAVRHAFRHRLRECLSILDLTDQQKTDIQGILEAAKPAFEADVAAVRAARQALKAAADAVPPDACAVGTDFLAVKSAVATLRAQRDAVRGQVLATLRPDQQTRLMGCLDAPRPDAPAAAEESDD